MGVLGVNILFVMSVGFDRRTPSEHLLTAMVEALYQKGHTVHIVQKNTGGPLPVLPEKLRALGVTTDTVNCKPPKKNNFIARYLSDLAYVHACKKHMGKKAGYGAVFVQSTNVAGAVMSLIRKKLGKSVPITFNVQDIFPYNAAFSGNLSKGGIPFKVLAAWQRSGYKKADNIITISEDMKELLIEDGVPADKIEVVYNWSYRDEPYNVSELDCTVAKTMFPDDKFNVVYAGNIGVMQNVEVLINAASLMQNDTNVCFHVIGDGAYRKKLEARVQEQELGNVRFWNMLSSDLAPSIYATADVNVIPLVKDVCKTALPSKTATCFACGKPIIMCIGKDSKFAQMAHKKTGCHVLESNDAEGLKNAILNIRDHQDTARYGEFFAEKLGKTNNSRKYAEKIIGNSKIKV